MKKIFALMLVLSLFGVVVKAEPQKFKIEPKALPPFKIFLTNYKPDPARDNLPIVEYDGSSGYTIYKIENYSPKENVSSYRLVLDGNGNSIISKLTDPDYYENLFKAFHSVPYPYFVGDSNVDFISITVVSPPARNIANYAWENKFFKKGVYRSYSSLLYGLNPFPLKSGAICYLDNNFQIEWRERQNDKMVVTRRQAINPDAYKPKYNEIPGLDASLNMGYRFYRNYCKGFVLCANNAKSYSVNGKTFDHSGFVSLINNTTFVDFFMLLSMLNCEYTYIKPQNGEGLATQYMAYRLFKIRDKGIETIKLLVSVDSAEYDLNGIKGKFKSSTFWKSDTIMVPLKEACDALKAKVIYRPLDGTILISRFFEY